MKDVEFHVGRKIYEDGDAASIQAFKDAISVGSSTIDVVVYSEEGARSYGGDDAADRYLEDPEASVFERFEIRVNCVGRVP